MSVRPPALFAIAFTTVVACAQEAQWIQDFAEAKAKAVAEKKDLLIDFTGSDWCIWCKRLDQEVFAQEDFQKEIAKGFILVKLDFPNDKSLVTDAIRQQNEKLQGEWGIEGFPSVFLADADGRPYAQTGYQKGGGAKYLEHVTELQKAKAGRDEHFTKAKDAKGVERATHLAAGLDALGETLVLQHYQAEVKEIIALDGKNEGKLKEKYEALLDTGEQKKICVELQQQFGALAQEGKWDEADKAMDGLLATHKGRKLIEQMATFHKAIVAIESRKDYDTGLKLMDAAAAFDPKSEMGERIPMIKGRIEKMRDEAGGGGEKKKDAGGGE